MAQVQYLLKTVDSDGYSPWGKVQWPLEPGRRILANDWDPSLSSVGGLWGLHNGNGNHDFLGKTPGVDDGTCWYIIFSATTVVHDLKLMKSKAKLGTIVYASRSWADTFEKMKELCPGEIVCKDSIDRTTMVATPALPPLPKQGKVTVKGPAYFWPTVKAIWQNRGVGAWYQAAGAVVPQPPAPALVPQPVPATLPVPVGEPVLVPDLYVPGDEVDQELWSMIDGASAPDPVIEQVDG